MVVVSLVIAGVGHFGFRRLNREIGAMYEQRLIPATEFVGMRADLMEARAVLMAMIYEPDAANRAAMHQRVGAVSRRLDDTLAAYRQSGLLTADLKGRLAEFESAWNLFKQTREAEIVPAVSRGEREAALALATGIQGERLSNMSQLINGMIQSVKDDAAGRQEQARAMSARLVLVFWLVALFGMTVVTALNAGLANSVTGRLQRVVTLSQKLAHGELGDRLRVDSQDEIGQMSEALNKAVDHMQGLVGSLKQTAADLEQSNKERDQVLTTLKVEKSSLEMVNKVMINREERILELKKEINQLMTESGRPPRYSS